MLYTLIGVNLTRLIYRGADLTRVLFPRGADLTRILFSGADLTGRFGKGPNCL